jgi:hypothetical protein
LLSLKTKVNDFLWFGFKTSGDGFFGLCLKTGSSGLVIWVSKSPQRFLGLSIKIKQVLVCWLRHKTDGVGTAWDTRRHLVA